VLGGTYRRERRKQYSDNYLLGGQRFGGGKDRYSTVTIIGSEGKQQGEKIKTDQKLSGGSKPQELSCVDTKGTKKLSDVRV